MEIKFENEDDVVFYEAMDIHSRYFNFYNFIKNGIPQQIYNEDLYTLEEVAEITKLSIVTIRQYVRKGKLKAIKHWKNWMVPSNEIARLIYEKKHGVQLEEGTVMLVALEGELYEEDSVISNYKIITPNDLLNSVDLKEFPKSIEKYLRLLLPNFDYLDAISNIKNFFRRSRDLKDNNLFNTELDIDNFINSNFDKLKYFVDNHFDLLCETPKEALKTVEKHYGELNDELTILKLYIDFLQLARIIENEKINIFGINEKEDENS